MSAAPNQKHCSSSQWGNPQSTSRIVLGTVIIMSLKQTLFKVAAAVFLLRPQVDVPRAPVRTHQSKTCRSLQCCSTSPDPGLGPESWSWFAGLIAVAMRKHFTVSSCRSQTSMWWNSRGQWKVLVRQRGALIATPHFYFMKVLCELLRSRNRSSEVLLRFREVCFLCAFILFHVSQFFCRVLWATCFYLLSTDFSKCD